MNLLRAGALSVLATALFAHTLPAYDKTCADVVSLHYFEAQTEYQDGLYDLIAADAPQFDGLAKLSRDQQLARRLRQRRQMVFLLEQHPARLVTTKGFVRFVNFDWSDDDNAQWLKHDSEAAALEEKIAALDARSNGHPQWPDLRAYYRERLFDNPQYKALTKKLDAAVKDVTATLASCN